jgi:hypothetical protein
MVSADRLSGPFANPGNLPKRIGTIPDSPPAALKSFRNELAQERRKADTPPLRFTHKELVLLILERYLCPMHLRVRPDGILHHPIA